MNKPIYLGLSILELSKILIHKFRFLHKSDYVKTKYNEKSKIVLYEYMASLYK